MGSGVTKVTSRRCPTTHWLEAANVRVVPNLSPLLLRLVKTESKKQKMCLHIIPKLKRVQIGEPLYKLTLDWIWKHAQEIRRLLRWSTRLAHSSVTVGNLVSQIWIGFGDLLRLEAKDLADLRKRVCVLPTRLTGKPTQVSIWGPLSQSCYGPSLAGPCGQEILRVHIWSKPYPAIAQAPHFSTARRCTIAPRLSSWLPPYLTKPDLTSLWAIKMKTWVAIFFQLRKRRISTSKH